MPDYARPTVARFAARLLGRFVAAGQFTNSVSFSHTRRAQCLLDRDVDGVKLMIASHLLSDRSTAEIFENNEVANKIQKAPLLKDFLDCDLKLWQVRVRETFAGDRTPRLKPLPARAERTDPGLNSVRN